MKRSMTVSLVLVGSAAMGLPGCKPKAEAYPSAEACIAAGRETPDVCRDAFKTAELEHERQAPHFLTRDQCVAAYGPNGCEEHHAEGGGGFFMPLMLGYMMGRGLAYHPLYQDPNRRDGMVGPGGVMFNNYTGGFSGGGSGGGYYGGGGFRGGGSSADSSSTGESGTVSRGGFGAAGHGSSGGE